MTGVARTLRRATLAVLLALATSGPAHALGKYRPRVVHVLTDGLTKRLSPGAQHSVGSLVSFTAPATRGSGVLVGLERTRGGYRALVLTASHVVKGGDPTTSTISLADGTVAKHAKLISHEPQLDYALVELHLPRRPNARVARLDGGLPKRGTAIYTLGANTRLDDLYGARLVHGTKTSLDELATRRAAFQSTSSRTISRGEISTDGIITGGPRGNHFDDIQKLVKGGGFPDSSAQLSNSQSAPGASGGPTFDAASHLVVGLVTNGYTQGKITIAGHSPTSSILAHLEAQHAAGALPTSARAMVESFLRSAKHHAP